MSGFCFCRRKFCLFQNPKLYIFCTVLILNFWNCNKILWKISYKAIHFPTRMRYITRTCPDFYLTKDFYLLPIVGLYPAKNCHQPNYLNYFENFFFNNWMSVVYYDIVRRSFSYYCISFLKFVSHLARSRKRFSVKL